MEWQICLMEVTKIIFLADPEIICIEYTQSSMLITS